MLWCWMTSVMAGSCSSTCKSTVGGVLRRALTFRPRFVFDQQFLKMSLSKFTVGLSASAIVLGATLWASGMEDAPDPGSEERAAEVNPMASNSGALVTRDVSLDQAQAAVEAAVARAAAIDTKMDIAVVDAGGNLKAFVRMDGAWLGSIDIAIKKAKTARWFDMPTGDIGGLSQPGGPLYNIEHSNGGLITFPGGVPLKLSDGTIIGAIGVSGSSVENDHDVASAGAAALGRAQPRSRRRNDGARAFR